MASAGGDASPSTRRMFPDPELLVVIGSFPTDLPAAERRVCCRVVLTHGTKTTSRGVRTCAARRRPIYATPYARSGRRQAARHGLLTARAARCPPAMIASPSGRSRLSSSRDAQMPTASRLPFNILRTGVFVHLRFQDRPTPIDGEHFRHPPLRQLGATACCRFSPTVPPRRRGFTGSNRGRRGLGRSSQHHRTPTWRRFPRASTGCRFWRSVGAVRPKVAFGGRV